MAEPYQRIGEYVLDERIGGGAFGEVWRAHHHAWTDRVAAVKLPANPDFVRGLQREGLAVNGLDHPNIVRALAFDPYADPPYLVTEFVAGTSLRPLIDRGPLPVDHAVTILRQVLLGLAHAHARGVVHRDLKPENILVADDSPGRAPGDRFGREGAVKLTDFGLGLAVAVRQGSILMSTDGDATRPGQLAGTPEYMAPEQRRGEPVDGRADLYACGVVLYELLTGQRPVGVELPSEVNSAVPPALDGVFRRAYARLERRFQTATEFLDALPVPVDGPAGRTLVQVPAVVPYAPGGPTGWLPPQPPRPVLPADAGRPIRRHRPHPIRADDGVRPPPLPAAAVRADADDFRAAPRPVVAEEDAAAYEQVRADADHCVRAINRAGGCGAVFDKAVALRLGHWRRGAELGWPEALWLVGRCHERGVGVDWDLARAARLYRQAAVQGYAPAMNNLGFLYLNGRGVDRNPRVGWRWYERAARLGYEPARHRLDHLGLLSRRRPT